MYNISSFFSLRDIIASIPHYRLISMLGWQSIRQRYRRSKLGAFWLTISMGILIGVIGFVFGTIFHAPMKEFLPFIAIGIILWNFISSIITESCTAFIDNESIIKQLYIPLPIYIASIAWKNIIILGHNIIILPIVLLVVAKTLHWFALLSIIGFLCILINVTWVALVLAICCARYRDLTQIVSNIIQLCFYLTPIIWMPNIISARTNLNWLNINPIFHLFELVRAPLLGQLPTTINWTISIIIAIIGWMITLLIYNRYKYRIVYWL